MILHLKFNFYLCWSTLSQLQRDLCSIVLFFQEQVLSSFFWNNVVCQCIIVICCLLLFKSICRLFYSKILVMWQCNLICSHGVVEEWCSQTFVWNRRPTDCALNHLHRSYNFFFTSVSFQFGRIVCLVWTSVMFLIPILLKCNVLWSILGWIWKYVCAN